jgi:hypothetical protein
MYNYAENAINILKWIQDRDKPGFKWFPGHSPDYFGDYPSISEDELRVLVDVVNSLLILDNSKIRVCWIAGEIRPVTEPKRIYIIDEDIENDLKLHLFVELGMTMRRN